MLAALVVLLRSLALICCGHRAVAFENLALRQQLAVFRRTVKRSQLRQRDRLFWMLLANTWRDWRTALVVVHPDTVVRWHRQWLRRRWTRFSARGLPGRPSTNAAIRTLVIKIAAANPLWGAPRIHGELGNWASRSRSEPFPGFCGGRAVHRRKHGEPSSRITSPHSARSISSPYQPSPVESSSSSSSFSTTGGGSFISTLPSIRRQRGRHSKSSMPFPMTRHQAGCCAIATRSTARRSAGE